MAKRPIHLDLTYEEALSLMAAANCLWFLAYEPKAAMIYMRESDEGQSFLADTAADVADRLDKAIKRPALSAEVLRSMIEEESDGPG